MGWMAPRNIAWPSKSAPEQEKVVTVILWKLTVSGYNNFCLHGGGSILDKGLGGNIDFLMCQFVCSSFGCVRASTIQVD